VFQSGTDGYKSTTYNPPKLKKKKKRNIDEYIIEETVVKTGSELIMLWIAIIELKYREILSIYISKEQKNMFIVVVERFLSGGVNEYGEHSFSTDGDGTWYPPPACRFLKLDHHPHSFVYFVYRNEKSIIERTMQYIKDRLKL
jgi:putative transposase